MGNFDEKLPKWENPGTEPPASKQEEGWQPQERPPAGWLNWLFNRSYKAIEELQEKAVTRDEGDFAARQELEEHKEDDSAHGIGNKLQDFSEHVENNTRHIYQGDAPPQDAEVGSLWLDTSDNAYQGTVMKDFLETKQRLDSHLADYVRQPGYGTTGGSANAYTLMLNPALAAYVAGVCVAVKIHAANTGTSTLNINGLGAKSIRDSKGNTLTAEKLIVNGVYTLRYDGTNFILQGEGGSGNAIASDLLSGKTASVDAGDIVGTMPNRGAVTITPSTADQVIADGYHNGTGKVIGDSDLTPSNIREGINIFNIIGTLKPEKKWASGTVSLTTGQRITISGLTFQPSRIIVARTSNIGYHSIYDKNVAMNYYANPSLAPINIGGTSGDYINATGFSLAIYSVYIGNDVFWWAEE